MFVRTMQAACAGLGVVCLAMTAMDLAALGPRALSPEFFIGQACTAGAFGLAWVWGLAAEGGPGR